MQDKFISFLGMCRKAGKLNWGHDTCLDSIMNDRAKICLLASDASERLKKEFLKASTYGGRELTVIETEYSMQDIKNATGIKAGVLSTEDEGFAKKMAELHRRKSTEVIADDQ